MSHTFRISTPLRESACLPGLVLALGAFLTQFDVTAAVVAMPSISHDLKLDVAGFAWMMDAYSLAFTAALLVAGALADRLGRRRVMLAGNLWFLAASLACGWAWNGPTLWAARAAQGVGAAFVITGAIALISHSYPEPGKRAQAFARMGIVSGIAMALGPTLGGALAASLGWRWIFWANVPLCALIAWAVPRLVTESRDTDERSVDAVGITLLTSALGVTIASLLHFKDAPAFAGLGLLGSVTFVILFIFQQRRCVTPLFDMAVFAQPAMLGIVALLFTVSVGYWAVLVYLPLFLQSAFGWPAGAAGLALLCATVPMLVLPAAGGHLVMRWGLRRLFAAGLAIMAAGDLLLAASCLLGDGVPRLVICLIGMIMIGSGSALAHPQLSGAVLALVPPRQAGMASAITVAARQAGFAIGIAALGAMLVDDALAPGFVGPFLLAAVGSIAGLWAALRLLPIAR